MAIGLLKKNYETQVCQFVVDDVTEISLLPNLNTRGKSDPLKTILACAMGSTARITGEDSIFYILTGENKWKKKTISSGGSSGGGTTGGDDYEYADEEDIDSLFPSDGSTDTDTGDSTVEDETLIVGSGGTVDGETWII